MKRSGFLLAVLLLSLLISCASDKTQPVGSTTVTPSSAVGTPSAPTGINTALSAEEIENVKRYWCYDSDWAMSMPCAEGWNQDPWTVGLGDAYESTRGMPCPFLDTTSEPAEDLAALSFGTVEHQDYDGFSTIVFRDFYGDQSDQPEYCVTCYISTTQPDCNTPRGIHPGNTLAELKESYPEVEENEGYEDTSDDGNAPHDSCWFYAPEGTNRSILFLLKEEIIVQIDMIDGLDGQICSPSGSGVHNAN